MKNLTMGKNPRWEISTDVYDFSEVKVRLTLEGREELLSKAKEVNESVNDMEEKFFVSHLGQNAILKMIEILAKEGKKKGYLDFTQSEDKNNIAITVRRRGDEQKKSQG